MVFQSKHAYRMRMKLKGKDAVPEGVKSGTIIIGWSKIRKFPRQIPRRQDNRKRIKQLLEKYYRRELYRDNPTRLASDAAQNEIFHHKMKPGDLVLVASKDTRFFYIARIRRSSRPRYHEKFKELDTAWRRRVSWLNNAQPIERRKLSKELQKKFQDQKTISDVSDFYPDVAKFLKRAKMGDRSQPFARKMQIQKQVGNRGNTWNDRQPSGQYNPEFSGRRSAYKIENQIRGKQIHGKVIERLRCTLRTNLPEGWRIGNDKRRDLYVLDAKRRIRFLFEAKTTSDPSHIYTAVGQLFLNLSDSSIRPVRVLVIPKKPDRILSTKLSQLGIKVLVYDRRRDAITFSTELIMRLSDEATVGRLITLGGTDKRALAAPRRR